MLSILIPIYNFDVVDFVKDLSTQASLCKIDFEILCFDDGSTEEFKVKNRQITTIQGVVYNELPQNVGRSKIRNLLATNAKYDYLLFLDGDSKTNTSAFIKNYISSAKPNTVVYGGRNYEVNPPTEKDIYFRWWYGLNRETIAVNDRAKQPYHSFMTNNFLIPRDLFLSIKLNEELTGYGHEDTLLGIALKTKQSPVLHIDNPLCHIGLESVDEFLKKTREGIQNLVLLINSNKVDNSIKLYRYYELVKKIGVETNVLNYYFKNKSNIEKKLKGEKPNLRWFDLYKLGYLISLMKA